MALPSGVVLALSVSLVETAVLLSGRGQATRLAALVYRSAAPVDASVATDRLVRRVDEDDLVLLVGAALFALLVQIDGLERAGIETKESEKVDKREAEGRESSRRWTRRIRSMSEKNSGRS